mmetsp:Transcript_17394/g.26248  ORF Transcript_17394/g.26248 Transcript_17394/m.26248 type:complete len:199 (+) Transcript_17394:2-598(+)
MKAAGSPVMDLMRGTFGNENVIEEVKLHDAEVFTAWEPFYRALFEKLKQVPQNKIVFVYHCWRLWIVDVLREYFPTSKIVEVQVARSVLLKRFVERQAKNGVDHEALWRDDQREQIAMLREKYGPEYRGNEENYKKFCEWRYFFYREPIIEGPNIFFINNDDFDGAQQLEQILNLTAESEDVKAAVETGEPVPDVITP